MSEERGGQTEAATEPASPSPPLPPPGAPRDPRDAAALPDAPPATPNRATVTALAVLPLVVVIGIVAASPYWAPDVMPLLPWGNGSGASIDPTAREAIAAQAKRVKALEESVASGSATVTSDKAIGDLARRLDALAQRLDAVEKAAPTTQANTAPDLTPLRTAVEKLTGTERELGDRLAALEHKEASPDDAAALQALKESVAKLGTEVGTLDGRVDKLAAPGPADTRRDQALLLALGQLRQALAGSQPYAGALTAAQTLAKGESEIEASLATLGEGANGGIPSLAVLRQHFAEIAGRIATADATAAPGWGEWALGSLRALFAARRVGSGVAPGSADAAVATAESALAAGDLAGAVAALDGLSGGAAKIAAPWLEAAHRRLAAEAALAATEKAVAARLAKTVAETQN